jgi:two-component system phosphate regulon sensor histidine kinase PhoR
MKNLTPFHILLSGSSIVALTVVCIVGLLGKGNGVNLVNLLIVGAVTGSITFITFYFFIKTFLTQKLRILYRSIRKGKFNGSNTEVVDMREDVIEKVADETKLWSEERYDEISKLREQEQFRKEFIGNIAHELKTPVFSIQGYILTLLDGGLEDKKVNRAFLERASKATERMTHILDDLDQLTRMEVNEVPLDITIFDIKELVQDVFDELEIKAKKKKINLRFSKDFDLIKVKADRNKIGQVITNIVSNSISYGNEKGETVVRFYILDNIITIEISDNGPGIDQEHLPRLFERFYRVEKSRNRNEGGSGLGLAIAKIIVEAHGQTISVRSTPGVGSTFTFSLDKGKR